MTSRPALDLPAAHDDAAAAAQDLAAQMQAGLDAADADVYDASFAADLLWGSPYGRTLRGFDQLIAIHRQLMAKGTAPASRFEVVGVVAPAPDVAVAHIRRQALDGGFSEMALYVLVRRDDRWWLAAGQNTPIGEP